MRTFFSLLLDRETWMPERSTDGCPPVSSQTEDRTHNLLVMEQCSNQLSHTGQGLGSLLDLFHFLQEATQGPLPQGPLVIQVLPIFPQGSKMELKLSRFPLARLWPVTELQQSRGRGTFL